MPTPKNGFQILNLHPKKHILKKKKKILNVLLPKFYQKNFLMPIYLKNSENFDLEAYELFKLDIFDW